MNKAHLLYHKSNRSNKKLLFLGDVIGWIGAAMLISAYLATTLGLMDGHSLAYQLLNLVGSACMGFLAYVRTAVPSIVVNTVWFLIGLVAVVNIVTHFAG